ncbi:MAG: hypothetical protein WHS88_03110 [Anaerohalosphaeraceae bacterium]
MKRILHTAATIIFIGLCVSCRQYEASVDSRKLQEAVSKDSLVYIQIASSRYDLFQPWKRNPSQTAICFGAAVGPYEVVTLAEPFAYATLVQVKTQQEAQFVPAEIKAIDYDLNLCLLKLDEKALSAPLKPAEFKDKYKKNLELTGHWLASDGTVKTSRGFLDRVIVRSCPTSYQRTLTFVLSSTSRQTSRGEVFADRTGAVYGIAFDSTEAEVALIPSQTVVSFLRETEQNKEYSGYGTPGFETYDLVDPTVRRYLKLPEEMKDGCYVSVVYAKGTGSDVLKAGDVLLALNGKVIDAFGKYQHPDFEKVSYEHLIHSRRVDEPVTFTVFRDGKKIELAGKSMRFDASEMLVPYQEYGKQPKYFITGGYVFQKLTLDYLRLWGENWQGKVPPHLFHYYRNMAMTPPAGRKEIVILSYVLPADINLGYQNLGRIVVKSINGMEIGQMTDIPAALKASPDSPFHVVEFEMGYPTVVIPKDNLERFNQMILQLYGIPKAENILP